VILVIRAAVAGQDAAFALAEFAPNNPFVIHEVPRSLLNSAGLNEPPAILDEPNSVVASGCLTVGLLSVDHAREFNFAGRQAGLCAGSRSIQRYNDQNPHSQRSSAIKAPDDRSVAATKVAARLIVLAIRAIWILLGGTTANAAFLGSGTACHTPSAWIARVNLPRTHWALTGRYLIHNLSSTFL
jgi:hypothetical protein